MALVRYSDLHAGVLAVGVKEVFVCSRFTFQCIALFIILRFEAASAVSAAPHKALLSTSSLCDLRGARSAGLKNKSRRSVLPDQAGIRVGFQNARLEQIAFFLSFYLE